MTRYLNYSLSLILFLLLLKYVIGFVNKKIDLIDNYKWVLIVSCPKFYPADNYQVSLLNKKEKGYTFVNSENIEEWGGLSTDIDSQTGYKYVPDSLIVSWNCRIDMLSYELKTKLPYEKMQQFFENPIKKDDTSIISYNKIVVGMAPGGNVTVWMRAQNILTVIAKFKAENKGIWKENDVEFNSHRDEIKNNKEFANTEFNIFHYLHGIPYSVWEKGEKEYDYDVGFTSEDESSKISILTFYTKSGVIFQPDTFSGSPFTIDKSSWNLSNFNPNNNKVKKNPLPIMMQVEIENLKNPKLYHATSVVLPNDFEKLYKQQYLDSITGKKENFDRIIIGIKSGENIGLVWLEGKNKRIKVMEFKCFIPKMNGTTYESGGYSLPKGFNFPKWEGREKLIQPDIEFWQEK
ncbi:DUF2931 family protein [Flavobacterium sp.]|uniref:DUF2931 family protein n=1 Tax=Flavobacterium sp. TaxID=239 RepID=UPI002B6EC930|nr:DUF2931 family protein [Flavobacterium sp.]HSD05675.1 DUF2931 family protein [Flavobacterium sp.]